jgi:two-component system, cell cycle response regulator DivK
MAVILLVEDNVANMKLASFLLESDGHTVLAAVNAEIALTLAREGNPDLILMDIQLPGMDGITALKQLRADPKTNGIAAIAITASAMTHNRQTMLAEGFDGYQTKPISVKEFLAEVQRVLSAGR